MDLITIDSRYIIEYKLSINDCFILLGLSDLYAYSENGYILTDMITFKVNDNKTFHFYPNNNEKNNMTNKNQHYSQIFRGRENNPLLKNNLQLSENSLPTYSL